MIATLQELSVRSSDVTPMAALAAGTTVSLGLCAVIRLPIVAAYVAGAAGSKWHGVVLSVLFTAGFIAGTVLLGVVAVPADEGFRGIMQASKYLLWGLGAGLFVSGVLLSGVINTQVSAGRQRMARWLGRASLPGALLLGGTLGLLQTPACPYCGTTIQTLIRTTPENGLVPLLGFGAGQGIMMLSVGVLVTLLMPDLVVRLRTRMCSLEERIQLLAGNVLVVLGIYFVIVS